MMALARMKQPKGSSGCSIGATAASLNWTYEKTRSCFRGELWRESDGGFGVALTQAALRRATKRTYRRQSAGDAMDARDWPLGTLMLCHRWNHERFNHWVSRVKNGWFDPLSGRVVRSVRGRCEGLGTALVPPS